MTDTAKTTTLTESQKKVLEKVENTWFGLEIASFMAWACEEKIAYPDIVISGLCRLGIIDLDYHLGKYFPV